MSGAVRARPCSARSGMRPGRTTAGMDIYEATLRVLWRPMSSRDPDYAAVTGIAPS